MKRFKNIEEIWAYAKNVCPKGVVVGQIHKSPAQKDFSISVPKVLVLDPKLKGYTKIEIVFTQIVDDTLIDAFVQETNTEATILNSNDFDKLLYFMALNEAAETSSLTLIEAVQKVMAPIKIGDTIQIVYVDGDTQTDIVSGKLEDIKPVKDVLPEIKSESKELFDEISKNGFDKMNKAYKIRGTWYVDDNENNIYAVLREAANDSFTGGFLKQELTINGKVYKTSEEIKSDLEKFGKKADSLVNDASADSMKAYDEVNKHYKELLKAWNSLGLKDGSNLKEAAEHPLAEADNIKNLIERGAKTISKDRIRNGINSLEMLLNDLMKDPMKNLKEIDAVDNALGYLKDFLHSHKIVDGTFINK